MPTHLHGPGDVGCKSGFADPSLLIQKCNDFQLSFPVFFTHKLKYSLFHFIITSFYRDLRRPLQQPQSYFAEPLLAMDGQHRPKPTYTDNPASTFLDASLTGAYLSFALVNTGVGVATHETEKGQKRHSALLRVRFMAGCTGNLRVGRFSFFVR